MDPLSQRLMMGAAGGGPPVYIEDVFSTWLYTGTGSAQTITNGIDLSGKGGLVWIKNRSADSHYIVDTARGPSSVIYSNQNIAAETLTRFSSFNSNGFSLDATPSNPNVSGNSFASWTFRKQPKFFDVVTYTGDGTFPRAIPHNLGSIPGCIIIKCTSHATNWLVSHRGMSDPIGNLLNLNSTAAETGVTNGNNNNGYFSSTTSTLFYVGNNAEINAVGRTYVAYLFAHNAGGFGLTGTDNVISCGSFSEGGSGVNVNLGWEPQFLLVKRSDGVGSWVLFDTMRGMTVLSNSSGPYWRGLVPNSSNAESDFVLGSVNSTGFSFLSSGAGGFNNGTYIYIAIRRGPMRTPTSGTSVFLPVTRTGTGGTTQDVPSGGSGFVNDLYVAAQRSGSNGNRYFINRLADQFSLDSTTPTAEQFGPSNPIATLSGFQNTVRIGAAGNLNSSSASYVNYFFRRAPGFFDVVCYTGTGVARTVNHNLGVVPEMMIVKVRNAGYDWLVYAAPLGNTQYLVLNGNFLAQSANIWNNTTPTSSVFSLSTNLVVNDSARPYVAYLFASCPGVSKVGTYTGTGSTVQVNCGFTAGARFVLIKRTDATGDWYVWDSARGIVAANDPYLLLNSTATEVTSTDWIDPLSSGFEVSNAGSNLVNVNGGTYLFLAIA